MRKILLVFLAIFSAVWAEDPVIDVVNQGVVLPKIIVKDNSNLSDANLKRSFYNMIVNDLKVSSNFEVVDEGSENSNYTFEYALAKNGENLSLNIKIKAGGVEKANQDYTLNKVEQYPFLAHKGVKDSVQFLGLAPVEWMDHK
ncbi:Tol-Pal system protein TolB, partial [Campylobacter upsaliensis]